MLLPLLCGLALGLTLGVCMGILIAHRTSMHRKALLEGFRNALDDHAKQARAEGGPCWVKSQLPHQGPPTPDHPKS